MNLAKKLKLVLLTSAVMLSSKDGYAMEDAEKSTRTTPQARFSSLLPLSESNQLPRPSVSIPLDLRVKAMIVRASGIKPEIAINEQNQQNLQNAISKVPPADFLYRLQAIETNLLKKLAPVPVFCQRSEREFSVLMQGYASVITNALLLPLQEIMERGEALENMVEDLFTYAPSPIGVTLLQKPSQKYKGKSNYFRLDCSASLDLIRDALTLNAHQINHRTHALRENGDYLLPDNPGSRLQALHSLLKLQTAEIVERKEVMKEFQVGQHRYDFLRPFFSTEILYNDKTLLAASHLSNADLKTRLNQLNSLIGDPKYALKHSKDEVQRTAFILEGPDFISRLNSILMNKSILEDIFGNFNPEGHLSALVTIFKLPPDQINTRLAAIKQYKELLFPNTQTEARVLEAHPKGSDLLNLDVQAIYAHAETQLHKNYYTKEFLPKMGEKFRVINRSKLSDMDISNMMQIDLHNSNFSHQTIRPILSRFGEIYSEMFNPPSLEKPHSVLSSSVGEPAVAGPSSSHDVPTPHTFRTTGANKDAEIKHSAIYVSFPYQGTPGTAYKLIINHRTKGKGPEVRVHNPNTKAYIDLGTLPPSRGFSKEVFNLSPLIAAVCDGSVSTIRTELNFTNGTSDIHSFKIQSGEKTLKKVILGNKDSEEQPGVHVYAGNTQEWSEVQSDDVQQ